MAEEPLDIAGDLHNARDSAQWCDHRDPNTSENCRYRRLLESSDSILQTLSLPELLKQLAPSIFSLTGCYFLDFSIYDPVQNCMTTHYWNSSQECEEFDAFPVDECVSGWVRQEQQATVIPDVDLDTRYPGYMQGLRKRGVRSYCVVPLRTARECFGAMGVGKATPGNPAKQDLEFFTSAAGTVALALESQKLRSAAQERQQRLEGLVSVSQNLSSSLEMETVIRRSLSELRRLMHHEHAVLMTLEEDSKTLRKFVIDSSFTSHFDDQEVQLVPLQQSLSRQAIEARAVTIWKSQDLDRSDVPVAKALRTNGIQSLINVPLLSDDRVWGALNLASVQSVTYRQPDIEYLQQIAAQIASALRNARAYREIRDLKDRLASEKRYLETEMNREERWGEIIGGSTTLKRVLDYASIVAATDTTVLITGETGTGKECVARLIHNLSERKDCSFIKLNCAAIPTGLLESELFGHEKGAFTGAISQKVGRLELADKGTLFLDEIGEIPLELQPKLLRVLQDQEFERLGGTRTLRVDARVIAATNRDLFRAVEEKQFRSDLFYRLYVFPLHLPALRERREDIPVLVRHFVEKACVRLNRRIQFIPDETIEAMLKWNWPGNIRELENFIERSVILSEGNVLQPPLTELRQETIRQQKGSHTTLRDMEREHILEVLRQTRGVLSGAGGAAARLGLKRTTLQYKIQRLGISRMEYLD